MAATEPIFVQLLMSILDSPIQYSAKALPYAMQKLRQKDFELYRGLLVDPNRLVSIVKQCNNMDNLSTIMSEHAEYMERHGDDYGQKVFELIDSQIHGLCQKYPQEESKIFYYKPIIDFWIFKKQNGTNWNKIDEITKEQYNAVIIRIFNLLVKPILNHYRLKTKCTSVFMNCLPQWLFMLTNTKDNSTVAKITDRIIAMCQPLKTAKQQPLMQAFFTFMTFCQIEYQSTDLFNVYDNFGLFLNQLHRDSLPELTRYWMKGIQNQTTSTHVNVCQNLLNTSISLNSLKIIQIISNQLKQNCDFPTLHLIYQKVIKNMCKLTFVKQQTLFLFLDIITFYVVGFMNTERIDDELDHITLNYKECLINCRYQELEYCSYKMALLLNICQRSFGKSTESTRNILRELKKIYGSKMPKDNVEIEKYVQVNMFPLDMNAVNPLMYSMGSTGSIDSLQASKRYVGLHNIGNTCYMNSYVQALYMTKKFRGLVDDIEVGDSSISKVLSQLFKDLATRTPNIHPFKFKSMLKEEFKNSTNQEDSAEFGRNLIQQLFEDLAQSHFQQRLRELFYTCILETKECPGCKNSPTQKTFQNQIIVPLGNNDESIFLSKCLADIFKVERLNQSNLLTCEKCGSRNQAQIRRIPKYFSSCLVFALSRFAYDYTKKTTIKKLNPVNIEFQINLAECLPNFIGSGIYELYAFIVHIGMRSNGGHYITYARNISENPNLWYIFDDGYVTEKEVISFQDFNLGQYDSPYIFFYSSQTGDKVFARDIKGIHMSIHKVKN